MYVNVRIINKTLFQLKEDNASSIGHVMINFFFREREKPENGRNMKQKTSKEFQNDMAMACIVLVCTQFFPPPPLNLFFYISGSRAAKKISGMAVALWFHVASFRHQQHQKLYTRCCVYTFFWQALLKLRCFMFSRGFFERRSGGKASWGV